MYFFFQAEDGIRDLYVTGVQTCALPIWVDGQMSCSCKEPDCWNKLKKWADPKKWFDPNPAPPPPLVPLVPPFTPTPARSEEHTSELQSRRDLVCRLLLEKKKKKK